MITFWLILLSRRYIKWLRKTKEAKVDLLSIEIMK